MSLRDYDNERLGPLLGVSDEGSAASAICGAARSSAKGRALGSSPSPLELGVAHDAERLGSIGEVPVGPPEYSAVTNRCRDQVLMTTNVGSHVNLWHFLRGPLLELSKLQDAEAELRQGVHGYRGFLSGRPREIVVTLRLAADSDPEAQADKVAAVQAAAKDLGGELEVEVKCALLVLAAADVAARTKSAIDLAAARGIELVLLEGRAEPPTEGRPALPGVLNYCGVEMAKELLPYAADRGVHLYPRDIIDTDSVARQVWTGLHAAKSMGFDAGKYGLFPLTFQQMEQVVDQVQGWLSDWTPAPAFYVDVPWLDGSRVYTLTEAFESTGTWLELVARHGAEVVLIDTVDKSAGRHLVKRAEGDASGILTWSEIEELDRQSRRLGLCILWAGGIPVSEAYAFGRLGAFGIYVTTAVARRQAISDEYAGDLTLAEEREPTGPGIARVKLLLEAGFLDRVAGDAEFKPWAEATAAADEPGSEAERDLFERVHERWSEWLAR
jgi:hypothetical protein